MTARRRATSGQQETSSMGEGVSTQWWNAGWLLSSVSGTLSGASSRAVVMPFDVVKIRLQLQREPILAGGGGKYTGALHCARQMVREEGLAALWKGHTAAQLLAASYCAVQFPVYEALYQPIYEATGRHKMTADFLAGGLAGVVATTATYPFDILRTRLASQGRVRVYSSLGHGIVQIYNHEGIAGFYRGWTPTVVTIWPYVGLQFALYKALKKLFSGGQEDAGTVASLTAGATSGMAAKTIVYPLDVVKKRLQVHGFHGTVYSHHGTVPDAILGMAAYTKHIFVHEGIRGFFKGLTPTLVKAAPNSMVTFFVYELVHNAVRPSVLSDDGPKSDELSDTENDSDDDHSW